MTIHREANSDLTRLVITSVTRRQITLSKVAVSDEADLKEVGNQRLHTLLQRTTVIRRMERR